MFKKTGDVIVIENVLCSCGGTINKETRKCAKCEKTFVNQTDKGNSNGSN